MNEQILKIEQACLDASGMPVLLTGLGMFLIGLFLWIGGLKYLKVVTGFIGAGIGAGIGVVLAAYIDFHPAAVICISATVFGFGAMLAQQIIILLLTVVIFSFAFGTGYLDYTIGKYGLSGPTSETRDASQYRSEDIESGNDIFSPDNPFGNLENSQQAESNAHKLIHAGEYAGTFWEKIKQIISELSPTMSNNAGYFIMWCIVGGLIGLVLAQLLKLIIMAFCCSVVGTTAMISGGMLAIIAKGTPVWSNMQNHQQVLSIVFGVLVVFGWIFQMLTGGGKQSKAKDSSERNKE